MFQPDADTQPYVFDNTAFCMRVLDPSTLEDLPWTHHHCQPQEILKSDFAQIFPQDQIYQLHKEAKSLELHAYYSWARVGSLLSRIFPARERSSLYSDVL